MQVTFTCNLMNFPVLNIIFETNEMIVDLRVIFGTVHSHACADLYVRGYQNYFGPHLNKTCSHIL